MSEIADAREKICAKFAFIEYKIKFQKFIKSSLKNIWRYLFLSILLLPSFHTPLRILIIKNEYRAERDAFHMLIRAIQQHISQLLPTAKKIS